MLFERNCDSRSDMFRMFFQAVALGTLAISTAALGEDSTWAARAATEIQKRKLEVAVVPASTIVAIAIGVINQLSYRTFGVTRAIEPSVTQKRHPFTS